MREEGASRVDGRPVAQLAERQHGVVSAAQLYSLGLSSGRVGRRASSGWLHRVHRGVYAVGHGKLSRHGVWMAAVLACGAGSGDGLGPVLSHLSAARLWEIAGPGSDQSRAGDTHVTVQQATGRRRRRGIVLHKVLTLAEEEVTSHLGIPCTTAARTILDLASIVSARRLERAVDEADRLKLCTEAELRGLLERHRGRRGTVVLAELPASHRIGSTVTRSELEERFLALCREHGLPAPRVNARLIGLTVDFFWPAGRLVVEVDGAASHLTRRAFQDDRDRDSLLGAHGYTVIRFTWWDVTRRPAVVAQRIRRILARS